MASHESGRVLMAVPVAGASPALKRESDRTRERDRALDFVKAASVIAMVLHHSVNYYSQDVDVVKFVRFVSGAFIFIAGFLVTHHYAPRLEKGDKGVFRRLFTRGLKLLLLLVAANLCMTLLLSHGKGSRNLTKNGWSGWIECVFFSGDYHTVNFDLLAPIAYVLILCAIGLFVFRKTPKILGFVTCGSAVAAFFLNSGEPGVYYARHVAIGMLGGAFGLMPQSSLARLCQWRWIVAAVYALHLVVLLFVPLVYAVYVPIVVLNVAFLYVVGASLPRGGRFLKGILLLGQYSLFSYLWQIAVLQLLKRTLPELDAPSIEMLVAFGVTTAATVAAVHLLAFLRNQSRFADRLYQVIFA